MTMVEKVEKEKSSSKKRSKLKACTKCHNNTGQRIHRSLLIRTLLFWLPVRSYQCKTCHEKFLLFGK